MCWNWTWSHISYITRCCLPIPIPILSYILSNNLSTYTCTCSQHSSVYPSDPYWYRYLCVCMCVCVCVCLYRRCRCICRVGFGRISIICAMVVFIAIVLFIFVFMFISLAYGLNYSSQAFHGVILLCSVDERNSFFIQSLISHS